VIFVRFVIFETSAKSCISTAVPNAALSVNIVPLYVAVKVEDFHGNLKWSFFCHVYKFSEY